MNQAVMFALLYYTFDITQKFLILLSFVKQLVFSGDSDLQIRVTGALLLLPFIFSHTFVQRTWKPTRLDVVDSFIAKVCSETDVQEYIEHRRKSLSKTKRSVKVPSSVQPYILAVGRTWENTSHVYIIVDQILYIIHVNL